MKNLAAAVAAQRQMKKASHSKDCSCASCANKMAAGGMDPGDEEDKGYAQGGVVEQGDHADAPSPSRAGWNEPSASAFPREEAYTMADAIREAKSYRTSTSQADRYAQGGSVEPHKAGLQSEPDQDMDNGIMNRVVVGPDGRRRFGAMPSSIGPNGDSSLMLAKGGRIDEHDESDTERVKENLGSDMDHYPHTGSEESDTMAQDENFGDGQLKNEDGDQDQEAARKAMRKSRLGGIMSDLRQRHFGK